MTWFLVGLGALTVLVALYVVWLRPMLRTNRSAVLDTIEPVERVLYSKSETLLWNRFKAGLAGVFIAAIAVDWNSISPIIPEKYRPYLLLIGPAFTFIDGLIGDWLRRDTTLPLEVVAMRTDAPPQVKAAAAEAKAVVDDVKDAIIEAKAV